MVGGGCRSPPPRDRGGGMVGAGSGNSLGVSSGIASVGISTPSHGDAPVLDLPSVGSSRAARGISSPRGSSASIPPSSSSPSGGVHAMVAALDGGHAPRRSPRLLPSNGLPSSHRAYPPSSPPSRPVSPVEALVVAVDDSATDLMDVGSSVGFDAASHAGLLPLPIMDVDRVPLDRLHALVSSTASNAHVSSNSSGIIADSPMAPAVSSHGLSLPITQPNASGYVASPTPCMPCPAPAAVTLEPDTPMYCDNHLDSAAPRVRSTSPPSHADVDLCMADATGRPSSPCPTPLFTDTDFPPISDVLPPTLSTECRLNI